MMVTINGPIQVSEPPIEELSTNTKLLSQITETEQGRRYSKYINQGLTKALHPVIPLNASLSPNSNLKSHHRGKVPGLYNPRTGLWSGYSGWQSAETTLENIALWATWPNHNIGLKTAGFPSIDIDVDDHDLVNKIRLHIMLNFDITAVRERDNSPRCVLVYRLAPGAKPMRKCKIFFKNGGAIEFLGAGQQVVIDGYHPSGAYQTLNGQIQEVTHG